MKLALRSAAILLVALAWRPLPGQDSKPHDPPEKPNEVHGSGCVQAGVEARCLVLRDLKSGKLYNLLVADPRPAVGDAIAFTGAPFDGATYCMQGEPVKVTHWERDATLQCSATGKATANTGAARR
ncbi:MAG: hypothetical protein WCE75_05770 [Terracidiphilus sp.]